MQTEAPTIVREVRIAASPETIYEHFVDAQKLLRWKGRKASLDPRPGGEFSVELDDDNTVVGEYVELDPPRRVVFTWGWKAEGNPIRPGSSRVEVTLTPDGDETVVRLEHKGLPAEAVASHAVGWDHYLPRLVIAAPGGDAGPDIWE